MSEDELVARELAELEARGEQALVQPGAVETPATTGAPGRPALSLSSSTSR